MEMRKPFRDSKRFFQFSLIENLKGALNFHEGKEEHEQGLSTNFLMLANLSPIIDVHKSIKKKLLIRISTQTVITKSTLRLKLLRILKDVFKFNSVSNSSFYVDIC